MTRLKATKAASTKKPRKPSAKTTKPAKKKASKKKKVDPLQLALRRCRALIPYHVRKNLSKQALYYLAERYRLLALVESPASIPEGQFVVNQVLCDHFLSESVLSHHFLVCWEGHDKPEWVHQGDLPPSVQNQYTEDGIVPLHAYSQLVSYLEAQEA
jgi:hypothetical protein